MNLRQLQYFVAVVDEGSFTAAAQRLYVAQPSLSKQIAALESELGGPLLERLPRGVRLTPAGRAFLPDARATILSAERARRSARMTHDLTAGELEIATVHSIAIGLLPDSIRALRTEHPGILVSLREYVHREELEDGVRGGVSDIAIGPKPRAWEGPMTSLGWEEFILLLPENDPLLRTTGRVDLSALADRRWVLPVPTAGMATLISGACRDAGFVPRPAVHSSQVEALARFAACGLGPTLLPANVVPGDLRHLTRRLRRPPARELAAYTRVEWSPPASAFLENLWDARTARRPANAYIVP
ncbi:LysR family transcriptional regulator [Actinomadura spongiicola]|uniref:LysR family transcriptional regulator n=1 Tax=Actinomadura spongiicola TaxID=2303421 RepID=A0A372GHE6_9ACTN|nr:LysR family transcriptional regulator [Actinomadura spongiicola]RFS84796.1 LysR family transcriptional regulator [Actinomadura spongiicola]